MIAKTREETAAFGLLRKRINFLNRRIASLKAEEQRLADLVATAEIWSQSLGAPWREVDGGFVRCGTPGRNRFGKTADGRPCGLSETTITCAAWAAFRTRGLHGLAEYPVFRDRVDLALFSHDELVATVEVKTGLCQSLLKNPELQSKRDEKQRKTYEAGTGRPCCLIYGYGGLRCLLRLFDRVGGFSFQERSFA